MNRLQRLGVVVLGVLAASIPFAARAAGQLSSVDRERLGDIKGIVRRKRVARKWRTLLSYLKSGPSYKVKRQSASALLKAGINIPLKEELLKIAVDKEVGAEDRRAGAYALRGQVALLSDADIEKLLRSDEEYGPVMTGALLMARLANVGPEQVWAILDRYDRGEATNRLTIDSLIVTFAGMYLQSHKREAFDREIRPVLEWFLVKCAHTNKRLSLRTTIGSMLARSGMPGAVEVLIGAIRSKCQEDTVLSRMSPAYTIGLLKRETGVSMGYDVKTMRGMDAETREVVHKWLTWWEEDRHDPKYRLPPLEEFDRMKMPDGRLVSDEWQRRRRAISRGMPVSLAFLLDESLDPMTRQRRLSGMYKMTPDEIAVMRQLRCNTDADDGLRDTAVAKLVEHGEHMKKSFADEAAAMLWDERQTPRFRGYCIRYLHRSYDARPDPAILETLFRAAGAKEHGVRASAVHFLAEIAKPRRESKRPDAATLRRICARILAALRDENEHERVRMCAVRCCGSLGLTEAAPDIRRIAGDEALAKSQLRLSAIYCLGDVGGAEDIPFLESLVSPGAAPSSPQVEALRKLRKRLAQEQF